MAPQEFWEQPVKVDAIVDGQLSGAAESARQAETLGFDAIVAPEVAHDVFLALALASTSTARIELMSGIAVAFSRSPMTVAVAASDLHQVSGGRLVLGLGSQIKPHITKRFSMEWSHPAARMREFVAALHAIWDSWRTGDRLDFRGEFYRHTLMTPMFSHGVSGYDDPKVFVAGVGPEMTRVAGEVADGYMAHGFTTPEYFRAVTLVQLDLGLAASGRTRSQIEITVPVFVVTGRDETEMAEHAKAARAQLAFYGSTPAYRSVLEHHGWGALGEELNRMSKLGEWVKMGEAIDDEVLAAFAVVAEPDRVPAEMQRRYGGHIDRLQIGIGRDTDATGALLKALHAVT
jgi:probable F420-dependent oxidoreductase